MASNPWCLSALKHAEQLANDIGTLHNDALNVRDYIQRIIEQEGPGRLPFIVTDYVPPVSGEMSDWYFASEHTSSHSGLDINLRKSPRGDVELGYPVYATCAGMVVFAGYAGGNRWGNLVVTMSIANGWMLFWRYAHLQDVFTDTGEVFVPAGHQIGTIGKGANNRYYAHLHLDCWRGGMTVPEAWFDRRVTWLDPLDVWRDAGFEWDWGHA